MSEKSLLTVKSGSIGIAGTGASRKAHLMVERFNRWSSGAEVTPLMSDGLTLLEHRFRLRMQENSGTTRRISELFKQTRARGKTAKTADVREDYFRRNFVRIVQELAPWAEGNPFPHSAGAPRGSALTNWWMNAYASQLDDPDLYQGEHLHKPDPYGRMLLRRALWLDVMCEGDPTPPKLEAPCTESGVAVGPVAKRQYLNYTWDMLDPIRAVSLMRRLESGDLMRRILDECQDTRLSCSSSEPAFPGQRQDRLTVALSWSYRTFSWWRVKRADWVIGSILSPLVGTFSKQK